MKKPFRFHKIKDNFFRIKSFTDESFVFSLFRLWNLISYPENVFYKGQYPFRFV